MTWDELRALTERAVEIGSHTLNHPHLPQLSEAEIGTELVDSRARFEDELRGPCRFLAYPYGEHDSRVRAAARRAGYAAAFALATGADNRDDFALPRVDLYRKDNRISTILKTSPLRRPAAAVRRALKS